MNIRPSFCSDFRLARRSSCGLLAIADTNCNVLRNSIMPRIANVTRLTFALGSPVQPPSSSTVSNWAGGRHVGYNRFAVYQVIPLQDTRFDGLRWHD